MSIKELSFAIRRVAIALLCLVVVMWVTPLGIKWLLVQQLHHVLHREVMVQAVHLHPLSLSLRVDGLSVKNTEGSEWVGWQSLTVDVSAKSFLQRALVLDALTVQSLRVSVVHLGQGRFDFSDLLQSDSQERTTTKLPPFVLHELTIHDGRIRLEDRPFERTHTVEYFELLLPLVSSLSGENGFTLKPELSAVFNGAPVHLTGHVRPLADAPDGVLALSVAAFDLSALQAYVPQTLPLRWVRGKWRADLKLQFSDAPDRLALLLNGTSQLQDVVINDVHDRALLSFKTLAMSLSPSDVLAGPLLFSQVTLEAPQIAWHINRDGKPNWSLGEPLAQPEQSTPIKTKSPLEMQVAQFNLRRGVAMFSDGSVKPAVQTRITDINAEMTNISTQPGAQAELALKANLGSAAPLQLQARVQPLDLTAFLDAKLQVSGMDLIQFSGYAQKYLGYPIHRGKLSMDASYRIQDKQLQADNHVVIDHLTLGEPVSSPHAIDVPVSLGVSLLTNSSGQIDIDLPMSGAVDAPAFSLGGLVAQTIGNTLVKVVTAPVRAIGSLLGSEDKED